MKALILSVPQRTAYLSTLPIPVPSPTELLTRVHSIALNPIDSLYVSFPLALPTQTRVIGSDFSGTVISLGSSVPSFSSSKLREGVNVAGFLQGACSVNERPGAFAEYVVVEWDLVFAVREWMEMEEAAGVGLCGLTAAQGVFYRLGIEAPFNWEGSGNREEEERSDGVGREVRVFVNGATTSVGMYAAQLLHISVAKSGRKLKLYGTASLKHHHFLKAAPFSYEELVDYRSPHWSNEALEVMDGEKVDYAIDCISESGSVKKTASLVAKEGRMAVFRSKEGGAWMVEEGELHLEPVYGAVWEGLGVEVEYQGFTIPASPEARAFAVAFYRFLSSATSNGHPNAVQPNRIRLMPDGLGRVVQDGFALLGPGVMTERDGSRSEEYMRPISGEKLVYKLV